MTAIALSHDALRGVRLLLLDVDGVLTDGRLWYGPDGAVMKAFFVQDGLGMHRLQRAGVLVGVVTGRLDASVKRRVDDLRLDIAAFGVADKASAVEDILSERQLDPAVTAFVGDDVNDLPAFERVGLPIAVANAHPDLLARARFVTARRGGDGAVREVADAILGDRAVPAGDRQ